MSTRPRINFASNRECNACRWVEGKKGLDTFFNFVGDGFAKARSNIVHSGISMGEWPALDSLTIKGSRGVM